jgi:hypothetical protein
MEAILSTIKYKFELIRNAIITGNFTPLKQEIKSHLYENKNMYTVLTFFVILYVLYEDELYTLSCHGKHKKQLGGQTPEEHAAANAPKTPAENAAKAPAENAAKAPANAVDETGKKGKKGKNNDSSGSSGASNMGSGLCDGDNVIAKGCKVVKDGMWGYLKIIGYIILAGLIVISPFVIYIILVYMVLKIMFKGVKAI